LGKPPAEWKLVIPCEATQLIGTLGVVYGWFMPPTGWPLAIMIWGYALLSFALASVIKIGAYRLLDHRAEPQARHLARVEGSLISRVPRPR